MGNKKAGLNTNSNANDWEGERNTDEAKSGPKSHFDIRISNITNYFAVLFAYTLLDSCRQQKEICFCLIIGQSSIRITRKASWDSSQNVIKCEWNPHYLPDEYSFQLGPLKAHSICLPPIKQTWMFEQGVSAPRRTIVHFVFRGDSGKGREGGEKQNSHYKRTRSAGVIGIFGSFWFQSCGEMKPVRLELPSLPPLSFSSLCLTSTVSAFTLEHILLLSFGMSYIIMLCIPTVSRLSLPMIAVWSGQVWRTNEIN